MQELNETPVPGDLARANRLLAAALDSVGQGLLVLDSTQQVVALNARFAGLFALPETLCRPGASLDALLSANTVDSDLDLIGARTVARPGRTIPATFQRVLSDGRTIAVRWSALDGGGWACACEDVSERRRSETRIEHLARNDALTNLPNRLAFHESLQRSLMRRDAGLEVAVLLLDLDRFKQANDALGPRMGDALLQDVAQRLRAVMREGEMLARLGADEFAMVQIARAGADIRAAAESIARRAVDVLASPFAIGGEIVVLGASVGIAVATGSADGTTLEADALLHNAQLAVVHAKEHGRGTWRFFTTGMDDAIQARRALEMDLREALAQDQFELHFQPLISVRHRSVVAFEALIRWRHPVRGMVRPDEFIPLTEELGLIVPIGAWVLRTACATAVTWPATVTGPVRVAVNLSSVQFRQPDLVEMVQRALAETGLAGNLLELEITESVLLADSDATLAVLRRLRAMGVRISLDDFGTGYSSLSYLNSFPFDKLKIDKSFVQAMIPGEGKSPGSADRHPPAGAGAIVRAIAGLGTSLGISTTAEGVETRAQLEMLVADGCTEMQGYLFSPPRPASEVPALLEAAARRAA